MSADGKKVSLYVFFADDGLGTDDKLVLAAQRYTGRPQTLTVVRTERGKPYFDNCSLIHVSPSHSGKYFVCAIADFPVGVDVQIHTGLREEPPEEMAVRLNRIAKRYFSPEEAAFIRDDTCDRFFALWTARESYVKYTGQGIDGVFESLCVLPAGTGSIPKTEKPDQIAKWRALGVAFRQVRLAPDYTLCVCAQEDFSLEITWLAK
jgi:phosphopantetheinyl transferase